MILNKYLLLYVFAILFNCIYAQTKSKDIKDSVVTCVQCDSLYNLICPPNIFINPEKMEEFPGGTIELISFINNNIIYPNECKEKAIQGNVIVKFIINESGKIICPYIIKSIHPSLDKEALRIIKLMPNWKPAFNDNAPCKSCFTLPISFRIAVKKGRNPAPTRFTRAFRYVIGG